MFEGQLKALLLALFSLGVKGAGFGRLRLFAKSIPKAAKSQEAAGELAGRMLAAADAAGALRTPQGELPELAAALTAPPAERLAAAVRVVQAVQGARAAHIEARGAARKEKTLRILRAHLSKLPEGDQGAAKAAWKAKGLDV